jgi:Leucine-rich repeat (LRR) protein
MMNRTILTDEDIQFGVWRYGTADKEKQNPEIIETKIPDNIRAKECLWINIGTIRNTLTEKERNVTKKEWIQLLPQLGNIKYLWISGLVNQEFIDAICEMSWLKSLCIKWTSIKKLDKISNLNNLIHLFIGSSSKLENMNGLENLTNLITLQIEGFKLINDISPITKLKTLKGLHIRGDMWKKQYIDNLNGLENLIELEYFSLDGTEVKEKDIQPIKKLFKLKNLEMGYWWTKENYIELYKCLNELKYGGVKKAVESGEYDKYLKKIK